MKKFLHQTAIPFILLMGFYLFVMFICSIPILLVYTFVKLLLQM